MSALASDFRGRLFAAVPTPIDASGRLHREGLGRLVAWLAGHEFGGVGVGLLAGRDLASEEQDLAAELSAWRDAFPASRGRRLFASVGAPAEARRPERVMEAARSAAGFAARLGADVLLARPPGSFRGRPDRDRLVLEYHAEVAAPGLPILVSYRREASGGVAYGPEVLAQLLARPEVLGVEVATIDGIAAFQQVAALVREQSPDKLAVSGEERFLGYSLMSGADAAMVGIAAAHPSPAIGLIHAHFGGDPKEFLERSAEVDALARPIFRAPIEGSTLRLLRELVRFGVLPPDAANDPPRPGPGALRP